MNLRFVVLHELAILFLSQFFIRKHVFIKDSKLQFTIIQHYVCIIMYDGYILIGHTKRYSH